MLSAVVVDEQAELGHELGGVGNGTLYVFYGLTALLVSKPATKYLGARNALVRDAIAFLRSDCICEN
jgi:hypothetical protein